MTDKREQIKKLRLEHPGMPAAEIARRVGLSRERVRQILLLLELPTTADWGVDEPE